MSTDIIDMEKDDLLDETSSEREVAEATVLASFAGDAVCNVAECPGTGEAMTYCLNPDHWKTSDGGNPYFHRQRTGHGAKRRGRPRAYCSPHCSQCVDDHFDVTGEGAYVSKVRVWVVEHPAALRPGADVVGNVLVDKQEFYRYRTPSNSPVLGAENAVRQLLINGFLDCDPGCSLPGHLDLTVRMGGQTWAAHQAPAPDGNGSLAEAIGSMLLQPEVRHATTSLGRPKGKTDDAGNDIGDWGDAWDPSANASDEHVPLWRRVSHLLPLPLVRLLIGRAPKRPSAKAVAMVEAYARVEQSPEVRDLYTDLIRLWPDYADDRATFEEVYALLVNDVAGE